MRRSYVSVKYCKSQHFLILRFKTHNKVWLELLNMLHFSPCSAFYQCCSKKVTKLVEFSRFVGRYKRTSHLSIIFSSSLPHKCIYKCVCVCQGYFDKTSLHGGSNSYRHIANIEVSTSLGADSQKNLRYRNLQDTENWHIF